MEIIFKNVDFGYSRVNCVSKEVFKNLNIHFAPGKIHGIIGEIGVGKTTLLNLINCTILPTNGEIKIGDFIIDSSKTKEDVNSLRFDIGMAYQDFDDQFLNELVFDEIAFNLYYYNYHVEDMENRVSDSLKMVGLDSSYMNMKLSDLSVGERRKVSLASAIVCNPKILLLDNPTNGLDGKDKVNLIKLLRMLKNRYNRTIIIASHDVDFLHAIVDEVHVLHDKNIVMSGNKYDVFKNDKELKKYGLKSPKLIEFSNKVLEKKNVKIGYRDDINDLIKDIYRNVK